MRKNTVVAVITLTALVCSSILAGCGNGSSSASAGSGAKASDDRQVVIYSNADDEAIESMKHALDNNGFEGKYIFQGYGTSELGGKLLAEGTNLEADMVTMSTFYLESAQDKNKMFVPLNFERKTLEEFPDYCAPITSQEGAIIMNTERMKSEGLDTPASLKDLTKEEYAGELSITDIASSSTAWLLMQALVTEYGDDGAVDVLADLYKNAGDHIETSGSGPLKLIRAGEIAVGFGLRHQAVADKKQGLPVDYVDPSEGNFSLTESVAVLDKGDKSNPAAMQMAQCIIENGREELQSYYPNPLYEGEPTDEENKSTYPKTFSETLTFDLYSKHCDLSEKAKQKAGL